jgi:hypothetical protein
MSGGLRAMACRTFIGGCSSGGPDTKECKGCLGFAWRWSDGRPPTYCPTATIDVEQLDGSLICGRSHGECSGCKRSAAIIGLDEDVKRTADARERVGKYQRPS